MKKFYLVLSQLCFAMLLWCSHLSAQQTDFKDFKTLVTKNASRLGISSIDAENAIVNSAYTDEKTHVTFVYLQQTYQQIRVYNTIISAAFIDGNLQYSSGKFVSDIAAKAGSSSPTKTAATAIDVAARHLELATPSALSVVADRFTTEKKIVYSPADIAKRNIDVTLFWTPSDDKQTVRLTWNVNIDVKGNADWWNVRIDAQTGTYVQKDNWTVNEHLPNHNANAIAPLVTGKEKSAKALPSIGKKIKQLKETTSPQLILQAPPPPPTTTSATYRVIPFPVESPIHGSFANTVNPWLLAGAGNNATTLGWHFDSATNFNITRGNNVFAFLDRRANNASDASRNWPDTSSTAIPTLNFIHNLNTAQQPWLNTENKKVALDNLFYWNNLMHDVMYQYGLTEAAGSFQQDNMNRGGAGNDYVMANAQDSAGYSNANFSTPTDGSSGRMQMYTWSTAPNFTITAPEGIAGNYPSLENAFTSPNKLVDKGTITGRIVWYNDDSAGTIHRGCQPATNASSIAGNIVLIDAFGNTGLGCTTYAYKVKNAQNAGAIAVIIYFNTNTLGYIGGTDATITIPTIVTTSATGNLIAAQLNANQIVNTTISSGIYIDGDLDNGIIAHEYGHGVSNRLTGGPYGASCLSNAEQAGEGWSDYLALMMTTNWNTATVNDGPNARPVGTYAYGQTTTGAGIRRYPYSTNINIDPLTYFDMANGTNSTEVHNTGEIWCSTVWDMTWNIIQQVGSITPNLYNSAGTGGNTIALNLVMMGMKLQPCSPGFIDGRNAILAADSILYGYAHKCAIWAAFARRGMGYSASQGLSTSATDQTIATDLPTGVQMTRPLPVTVTPNGQITITHTATCDCQAASFVVKDTIPTGFTYVSSSPAGTLSGNVLTFPSTAFTAGQSQNFAVVLRAPVSGCTVDSALNDNRETATAGGFTSSGTSAWVPSTAKSHTPTTSWFALDSTTLKSTSLTSNATATTAQKPLSILSFWHNFRTQTGLDGGVVEYSTDGGVTWVDAAPLFMRNGYNNTMLAGSVLSGRKAFTGNSRDFQFSMLNLTSLGTASVSFRFRLETNSGVGVEGWYVDDIIRANGCGAIMNSGIYDASGVRRDSASVPVFVTPNPLPLTLLSFYANQVGSQVVLDWRTATEINVKDYTIEWSVDGTNWSNLGNQPALNRSSNTYSFIHSNPVNGNNLYRIKMNDVDGKSTYTPVRIITIKDKQPALVLLPNPVNTESVLYISREVKPTNVKVYDAAGSLVRQIAVGAGIQQVKIETANLAAGVYTVEANGSSRQIIRMMVQH